MNEFKKSEEQEKMLGKGQAARFNSGKRQWGLVQFEALEPMVQVLEYGLKKYAAHNWREGAGLNKLQCLESMQRHLAELFEAEQFDPGRKIDPESGLPHIGLSSTLGS